MDLFLGKKTYVADHLHSGIVRKKGLTPDLDLVMARFVAEKILIVPEHSQTILDVWEVFKSWYSIKYRDAEPVNAFGLINYISDKFGAPIQDIWTGIAVIPAVGG